MAAEDIGFEWGERADLVRMTIPFIHCNMGGEMVYILEQRLYSQKIRKDKIERVLTDIIKQLYNPKVFRELLKPGPLPSNTYMRGIFHTIANTSIMKLSEQSMEKMYELMVMGFKYQVLSIPHPKDLVAVTLNHIEANRILTEPNSPARQVIDNALVEFESVLKKITTPQFHDIKLLLCKFFQDRRTKVSLFLRESIQTDKGYFPLTVGGPMPNDELVEMPGVVRYHSATDEPRVEVFNHPLTFKITDQRKTDHFNFKQRDLTYGSNLYIASTNDQRAAAMAAMPPPQTPVKADHHASHSTTPEPVEQNHIQNRDADDTTRAFHEANFLKTFFGKPDPSSSGSSKDVGFKFSPFGDAGGHGGGGATGGEVIEIQGMTRDQFLEINSELVSMMDELEVIDKVFNDGHKPLGSCSSLLDLLRDQGLA